MTDATDDEPAPDSQTDAVEGGLDEPAALEPEQGTLALADERDVHSREEWEAAAAAVLRKARRLGDDDPDASVWTALTRRTLDGVELSPLGTPGDDGPAPQPAGRSGAWDVRVEVGTADPRAAHDDALGDLEGGATSLWLRAAAVPDYDAVLADVLVDLAPVVLDVPSAPVAAARGFVDWAGERELAPGTNLGAPADADDEALVEVARLARERGLLGVVVDATVVHEQGASDVQELAASLAQGVRALRVLEAAGVEVAEAAPLVELRYAATDEQLPTTAKLRAARRLWRRVLELSGVEQPAPARVHAVTSRAMLSRYDSYVNMLRTTVATFAAGVGGADAVTVVPFDAPLGRPEAFGRRIARNTSHLLLEESHVAVVDDPAAGSFVVERLTDDLATAAWELFGRLEQGEDLDALVAATAEERDRQVATRRRPLTGLTEFPDLAEKAPERADDPDARPVRRWGAAFEALRDDPPAAHVFLATLGPVAQHTARATFASNLLAAGGIAVDVAGATDSVADLVAAHDGQAVVCLAGADASYDEWGEQAAAALREAGATHVVVAGKPRDWADDACALGVDALAFLTRTKEQLA